MSGMSLAEMAALAAQRVDAAVARLVVGEEAWALLRPNLPGAAAPFTGLDGLLGVPIVVDSESADPRSWMMLDHAGRVLDSGRLG